MPTVSNSSTPSRNADRLVVTTTRRASATDDGVFASSTKAGPHPRRKSGAPLPRAWSHRPARQLQQPGRREGEEQVDCDCAAPIHDRGGGVLGAVLVFRDVSETRQLSRQLAARRRSRRADRARQPARIRASAGTGGREREAPWPGACALLLRSRPVQAGQRHRRPRRGRRAAEAGARASRRQVPRPRYAGPTRRRRVRAAARQLPAGRSLPHRRNDRRHVSRVADSPGRAAPSRSAPAPAWLRTPTRKDAQQLLTKADVACYTAKEHGRNRVHVYRKTARRPSTHHAHMLMGDAP